MALRYPCSHPMRGAARRGGRRYAPNARLPPLRWMCPFSPVEPRKWSVPTSRPRSARRGQQGESPPKRGCHAPRRFRKSSREVQGRSLRRPGLRSDHPGEVVDHPNVLVSARQPQPALDVGRRPNDDQLLAPLASLRVGGDDRAYPDRVDASHVPHVEDHALEPRSMVAQQPCSTARRFHRRAHRRSKRSGRRCDGAWTGKGRSNESSEPTLAGYRSFRPSRPLPRGERPQISSGSEPRARGLLTRS